MSTMDAIISVIGVIGAIVLTVLAYVYILPSEKRENLPKLLQYAHDLFNFKELYLEKIAKLLYVFITILVLCLGVVKLLDAIFAIFFAPYFAGQYFALSIVLLVFGPIGARIALECALLLILLCKNVMEINNKIK